MACLCVHQFSDESTTLDGFNGSFHEDNVADKVDTRVWATCVNEFAMVCPVLVEEFCGDEIAGFQK